MLDEHNETTGAQIAKLQSTLDEVKAQLSYDISNINNKISNLESKFDKAIRKNEPIESSTAQKEKTENMKITNKNKELQQTVDEVLRDKNSLKDQCASLRQELVATRQDAERQLQKAVTEITDHKNSELNSLQKCLHQKTKENETLLQQLAEKEAFIKQGSSQVAQIEKTEEINQFMSVGNLEGGGDRPPLDSPNQEKQLDLHSKCIDEPAKLEESSAQVRIHSQKLQLNSLLYEYPNEFCW